MGEHVRLVPKTGSEADMPCCSPLRLAQLDPRWMRICFVAVFRQEVAIVQRCVGCRGFGIALGIEMPLRDGSVEGAGPLRHYNCCDAIADRVAGGNGHREEAVDAENYGKSFDR